MTAKARVRKRTPKKPTRTNRVAGSGTAKKATRGKQRRNAGDLARKIPRKKRTCFVIMPFGTKPATAAKKSAPKKKTSKKKAASKSAGKDGSELWQVVGLEGGKQKLNIDFDRVYEEVIKGALTGIEDYEIEVIRCDEIKYSGWIHEKMIEQIASADIAIVELTTLNPNVFYELGVRHALSESVTVLIQLEGLDERIPFNLGGMSVVKYDDKQLETAREEIQQTVVESLLRQDHVDSLVFKTLPSLEVSVSRPRRLTERRFHHFPIEDLPGSRGGCLGVVTGDIANVEGIDVWVSSENTEMMMARYHERAISATIRYLGARLDETDHVEDDIIEKALRGKMRGVNSVPAGSVVVTTSGTLRETNRVNWIFHAASVIGQVGGGYHPIADVRACVNNALKKADSKAFREKNRAEGFGDVESILFPIFGTGQAGAELEDTINGLMQTARSYLDRSPASTINCVYFLAFTDRERDACLRVLESWGLREDDTWPDPSVGG